MILVWVNSCFNEFIYLFYHLALRNTDRKCLVTVLPVSLCQCVILPFSSKEYIIWLGADHKILTSEHFKAHKVSHTETWRLFIVLWRSLRAWSGRQVGVRTFVFLHAERFWTSINQRRSGSARKGPPGFIIKLHSSARPALSFLLLEPTVGEKFKCEPINTSVS